jgi:hypothetical protein
LRTGIQLRHFQEPFRLGALAKKAPDIRITMGEQAFDNMKSEETARTGNQDFQTNTSG